MLQIYKKRCAVSGCDVAEAIDAAHVQGIGNEGGDSLDNGILLRADLHRLFDRGLLAINPDDGVVHFSKCCKSAYFDLHGKAVKLPSNGPSRKAFSARWVQFSERL